MRIIAGEYKAKRLVGPKLDLTRPTLDRVKEAMFSILDSYKGLTDINILDLFSGTGNLGIEAISRGAKFAWLNDIDSSSIKTIIANILLTKYEKYVKITKKDYIKCLIQITKENLEFDVVFLDPPYDSKYGIKAIEYISNTKKVLGKNGVIIYETDKNFIKKIQKEKNENILDEFENLECFDTRNYGNVILKIYRWRN